MFEQTELNKDTPITLPEGYEDLSIAPLEYYWPKVLRHQRQKFIGTEGDHKCARCGKDINIYRGEAYILGREAGREDGKEIYVCKEHALSTSLSEHQIWRPGKPCDIWEEWGGKLWIARSPCGHFSTIDGFIVANSFGDACQCWRDELAADGKEPKDEAEMENPEWYEYNDYRSSGVPCNPRLKSGVYAKSNGCEATVERATPRLLAETYTWGMLLRFRIPAEKEGELNYPIEIRFTTQDWV